MGVLSLIALLLPASLAVAAKTSGICTKSTSVVNALQNPTGSSFCASLLGIPQTTVTSTSTITPKETTITRTTRVTSSGATVTKTLTARTTTTITNIVTAQSTTSTTVTAAAYSATSVNCISTTDQLQPYTTTTGNVASSVPNSPAGDQALEKRAADAAAPAPLQGQSRRRRRAFCSCLSLTLYTSTQKVRATASRPTSTVLVTSTVSARTVIKTATTTTVTQTIRSTTRLRPTTSTISVIVVTPTPAVYPGVNYYAFENSYDYGQEDPGFDATSWNSNDWMVSGTIQEINDEHTDNFPSGTNVCSLPDGNEVDFCDQVTFVNQGYFHAIEDGVYTISSDNTIDNAMYVWSGSNAYDNYNNGNEDYSAERTGSGPTITTGSQNYNLDAGDLVPFTIMAVNGGGPGRAQISVTTPDGESYGTDGFFIPACPAENLFSP